MGARIHKPPLPSSPFTSPLIYLPSTSTSALFSSPKPLSFSSSDLLPADIGLETAFSFASGKRRRCKSNDNERKKEKEKKENVKRNVATGKECEEKDNVKKRNVRRREDARERGNKKEKTRRPWEEEN